MRRGLFFFFFFFFLLFTFQNHSNLFWVYQNGNFLPGKRLFKPGKKSRKMTLPPPKIFPVTPLWIRYNEIAKTLYTDENLKGD